MFETDWKPDKTYPMPLHLQIIGYIKEKITLNEWPIGTKLPSQRALAELFAVNRSTIVAAMDELAAEGVIQGNTGGGTKVINNTWNLMNQSYNWNSYISSGNHQPNHMIVQQINAAESDPDMIRMGSCEPAAELIPQDKIQKILKKLSVSSQPLGYEEPRGSLFLREEICKYLQTIGIATNPSSVLITSGALQGLQLISLGLLHANSIVYLEKPSYLYSLRTFQSFGMQLSGIPFEATGINIKKLSEKHKSKRGSILFTIPTFHNPTGTVMPLEKRKELIHFCEKEGLPIIEDDVYREIWFENAPPPPLKSLDQNGLVLYVGGISKNLSPGLRIGWIVGSEQVIARLSDIKMQSDYGTSSLSQNVAAELFASGLYQEHNDILRKKVKVRRDTTLIALNKHFNAIATWNIPTGGYFIWLKLNEPISMHQLFVKALNHKVLIHPGDLYEFHSNQHIRISYSNATLAEISQGIKILSELVLEQEIGN
ncbi:PLP-dependent aminotransferase family protein [Clostridium sp. PL3]|uniref:HTH-type transcriptional regulator NorG n=1 Tax=Clostridium thailandense TaxID=2794346 RepID=A0A949TK95_9CLOT|nr:PLP-dependent aminotransferase family protein [Clostridium thailandense]MBV7272057.1 PLP-dependent aminotransferase family protein [Clostridium thailandense]